MREVSARRAQPVICKVDAESGSAPSCNQLSHATAGAGASTWLEIASATRPVVSDVGLRGGLRMSAPIHRVFAMTPLAARPLSKADTPTLRSLGPEYNEKLHGRHPRCSSRSCLTTRRMRPRTLRSRGTTGSGKSSVILGVQAGLEKKKIDWVNLSLSSLGIDDTKRARVRRMEGSLR